MKRIIFFILLISFFTSCGPSIQNMNYRGLNYFGQSSGGVPNGFGILKNGSYLMIGKFIGGQNQGWFKIVSPEGAVSYKYYENGRLKSSVKDLTVNSEFITSGNPSGLSTSEKAFGLSLKSSDVFFGNVSGLSPISGVKKMNDGLLHVGYQPIPSNDVFETYLQLPTGAKLFGQSMEEGKFKIRFYRSHTGYRIESVYEEEYKTFTWGDVKVYEPTTNKLAPQILISSFKNGDLYIGEGKNFKADGYGYLKTKEGLEIWGWFNNNRPDGDVIEKKANQLVYAGSYRNGKKNGIFFTIGKIPTFKFSKTFNIEKFQTTDSQFQKLEQWYYNNRNKESKLDEVPFEEDYNFEVKVSEILDFKIEYDSKENQPWQLNVTDKDLKKYLPGYSKDQHILGLYLGLSSPAVSGPLTNLASKNYHLTGTIYKNGKESGQFFSKKLSSCGKPIKDFKYGNFNSKNYMNFYGENCKSGAKNITSSVLVEESLSTVIYNAKVVNGNLVNGEAHLYDYKFSGFIGTIANGNYQGDIKFIRTRNDGDKYQTFINGKSHGILEIPGFYQIENKNGLAQGKGSFYESGYIYTGNYVNGFRVGQFTFSNIFKNTKGTVHFNRNGAKDGFFEEREANGALQQKISYVNGKKSGKGLCYYEKKSEPCEFRDDKRVDSIWTKRQHRIEQDREAAKRWLEDYYARKKKQEEEERREKAEYEANQRRREAIQAKIENAAREYDEQQFRNQYQQILENQRNYTNFYSNFSNYGSGVKSVPSVSSKPAVPSSRSSLPSSGRIKLKSSKPYKRCELTQSYDGKKFASFYDCNDQEATLPAARTELQRKITHYADTIRIQQERQAKAKKEDMEYQNRLNDACTRHLSRGGNICDKICSGTFQAKGQNCKAGAF